MRTFFVTLHRWLGFPLGLLFLITFATGALTSIDELIQRYNAERIQRDNIYTPQTVAQQAAAVETLLQNNPSASQLLLPSSQSPFYRVQGRGETWTYAIDDLSLRHHAERHDNGFFDTVLQLHRNYLFGREGLFGVEGKHYAAWVALLSLALSVLGLWLWWPLRKSFRARYIVPMGLRRKYFFYSHMSSGVVVLAAIVLLSLTGASITYRSVAQALLGGEEDKSRPSQNQPMSADWHTWLRSAYNQLPPGSQLTHVQLPRPAGQPQAATGKGRAQKSSELAQGQRRGARGAQTPTVTLRFVTPNDWLGLAGSSVTIDPQQSTLMKIRDFGQLRFGAKLLSILKPLHTGHHLPLFYLLVLLILSLLGSVMVFSGLISFATKKRKWMKRF